MKEKIFIPYLEGKPGDWVVFSPKHGIRTTGFWETEMVMQIEEARNHKYSIRVTEDLIKNILILRLILVLQELMKRKALEKLRIMRFQTILLMSIKYFNYDRRRIK